MPSSITVDPRYPPHAKASLPVQMTLAPARPDDEVDEPASIQSLRWGKYRPAVTG